MNSIPPDDCLHDMGSVWWTNADINVITGKKMHEGSSGGWRCLACNLLLKKFEMTPS